ncbi:metallophosphoesterase [Bacillus mojavensis]|uniref:metallophosphoesterase n=1 Tax=Bacillus mojavensis TaxID=72360 RepID=UPI002DBADF76|nr:metallophosphoesterase [Bacillus mojavensis]MEC1732040.1 metallophosphoesterase [Bacillus mojavensis]MED1006121.1 metallophosphoesterase [Bacillus mojavensis]
MRKYTVIASLLLSFLFVQSGGHHEAKALPVIKQEPFQTPHYIPLLENPPQIEVKAEMKGNLIIQAHVRDSEYQLFSAFLFYKQSNELGYKMVPMDPTPGAVRQFIAQIPKRSIWNSELEYYIVFSNGKQRVESETKTLKLDGYQADLAHIPELLITELAVDTKNTGRTDGYEFIEVYNTTDRTIDFKDYHIRYRYPKEGPDSDLIWRPDQRVVIPSGETCVFWLKPAGHPELTADDFNRHYQTHLREGENLLVLDGTEGMANTRPRAVAISTNTGKDISVAHYRKHALRRLSSVLYKYPLDGTAELLNISIAEKNPSPGSILQAQVPEQKRKVKLDKDKPVIEDLTDRKPVRPAESIELRADIRDRSLVKTAAFYYRTDENKPFKRIFAEKDRNDHLYHYIVYSPELIGKDQLEYYIVAGDGINEAKTPVKMIDIKQTSKSHGLRMNIENRETLSGTQFLKATTDGRTDSIKLWIDGKKQLTEPAMEKEVYFAFDTRKTNLYFKNAVTMDGKVLKVFDDTTNKYRTYSVPLPETLLQKGKQLQRITIRSGSKVSPFDTAENRDDFLVKNARLVLSDGTVIRDERISPEKELFIGDNQRSNKSWPFQFHLPDGLFTSQLLKWDTEKLTEGAHHIAVSDGNENLSFVVRVDNSGPHIEPNVTDGQTYKGNLVLQADMFDKWSKIEETEAFLDGDSITLPYHTSTSELSPGKHTLKVSATDLAGNKTVIVRTFKTEREHPDQPEIVNSDADTHKAKLSVRVKDPTNDAMDVSFYKGFQYTAQNRNSVKIFKHASLTEPPKSFMPESETSFTNEEMNRVSGADGKTVITEEKELFPYHRFEVTVDPSVDENDLAEAVWRGSSLPGRKVTMYAWNYRTSQWQPIDSFVAKDDKQFTLEASVIASDYVRKSKMNIIVQDEIPPAKDMYSFVWMSDTQYYAKSYPHIFDKQTIWIKNNQRKLNTKYVFHTGDIVDDAADIRQWRNADQSMRVLDNSGIPYGVLAGNHDVGHKDGSYRAFGKYFGSRRFDKRLHYGESYKNNRGHYDLISSSGNDYIMLYMGWGITDEDIAWMNQVLKKHPDRIAVLAFHEYLLVSGNRSPIGEKIFKKVVKPNPNVVMVLSGHYHSAMRKTDELDDDGDGKPDRLVHQMLADYQGGPEGGQGYLRLMQFDQANNVVHVSTYSPYLDDKNFYDTDSYGNKDEFTLELDLKPRMKRVETDDFECNVYTNEQLGKREKVKSGKTAEFLWENLEPNSVYYWYTIVEDSFNGKTKSPIWKFKTKKETYRPAPDQFDFQRVSNP